MNLKRQVQPAMTDAAVLSCLVQVWQTHGQVSLPVFIFGCKLLPVFKSYRVLTLNAPDRTALQ